MSATFTARLVDTDELCDCPTVERPTESLSDAVEGYAQTFEQMAYLQRASARLILDALDRSFPPSNERTQVRERVLSTLAWYRKEIERWVSLQAES